MNRTDDLIRQRLGARCRGIICAYQKNRYVLFVWTGPIEDCSEALDCLYLAKDRIVVGAAGSGFRPQIRLVLSNPLLSDLECMAAAASKASAVVRWNSERGVFFTFVCYKTCFSILHNLNNARNSSTIRPYGSETPLATPKPSSVEPLRLVDANDAETNSHEPSPHETRKSHRSHSRARIQTASRA